MTTWRSGVLYEDHAAENLVLSIGHSLADGRRQYVNSIGNGCTVSSLLEPGEQGGADSRLVIPSDIARAVYDALARHYGGTFEAKQLRADYDAERARVDKLIDAVIAPPPLPRVEYVAESQL